MFFVCDHISLSEEDMSALELRIEALIIANCILFLNPNVDLLLTRRNYMQVYTVGSNTDRESGRSHKEVLAFLVS